MKKYISRALLFLLLILTVLVSGVASDDRAMALTSRGGYEITSYDCFYQVTEDNVYHVVETIDVNFLAPRHGIYRYIPEVNHIRRADGTSDTVITEVDIKSCSDDFTESREGNNRMVKIGDKDVEITGQHTYTIIYDVKWGDDRVKDADEFYMNLIGDGWDVPVKNLTFTIDMPKEFSDTGDNIGFYYGPERSNKIEGIKYSFDGKKIMGSLVGYQIEPGAFFTTRILLEDGYFLKSGEVPIVGIISLVLCCVFLAVSLIIWLKVGNDDDVIEIVEFYPPDGLNCGEMAYAYYGSVTNKDLVPMIVGLAAKGYIQIIQVDDSGREFMFKILRPYEGTDEAEMLFMRGLSKYGAIISKKELENSFYKTLNEVNKKIRDILEKKIFVKNSLWWRYITFPFALLPYLIGLYHIFRLYTGDSMMGVIAPAGIFVLISTFTAIVAGPRTHIAVKIVIGLAGLIGISVITILFMDIMNYSGMFFWVVYFGCILANIGQMVFFRIIDKRTPYGLDLLGRIRGFRNYLTTAERPHLVALVNQDPQYFYKILPYTYSLDITKIWVEHFESIAMEPPHWYHGPYGSTFHYHSFNTFMNHTMTSAQSVMTSSPRSSGSGGGFSGGGGGGGGGGSW